MAESEVQRAALGACACELCDDAAADHVAWDASVAGRCDGRAADPVRHGPAPGRVATVHARACVAGRTAGVATGAGRGLAGPADPGARGSTDAAAV